LQSDSSKPKVVNPTEKQDGKFEGDWSGQDETETFHFEPETGNIPSQDRGILWGVVGAATLWGVFGPGKKNKK
jgi:hypothetical protein